jgi:hypothetical protein
MAVKKTTGRRGRERRGSERADVRLSMRVDAGVMAGAAKIVTESQNISASGVYCHASHYLAPLSKVQLTIILPRMPGGDGAPQELVKCDGIVVRCDQRAGDRSDTPYELACMFSGLEHALRGRIEEFVTWRNLQALRAALQPATVKRKPALKRVGPSQTATRKPAARGASARPARASATRAKAPRRAGRASR